jgi:DNA-binding LacI/PurR family transcriptional regulator
MYRRVSIKDVAKYAGVSVSTVSRVLAEHPYVKAETRQRVFDAIEVLDYQPDQVARSLRRGRTNLISLMVSTIENVYLTEVARAAEQAAIEQGYNLIVCNTEENPEREEAYLKALDQQMVAGVILSPVPGEARHLTKYIQHSLKIITFNRRLDHLPYSSVTADDDKAAFDCVSHLIKEGRTRIAAITGIPGVYTTQQRLSGYRRALETAGLPLESTLEITGQARLEGAYKAATQLMQLKIPPDALFVFNNLMTQGVIMTLQDLGISWPDQVDVAGFGVFKMARLYRPPLTLIKQPTYEMGRRAVEMLIDHIGGKGGDEPEAVVLKNKLIPREMWRQYQAVFN